MIHKTKAQERFIKSSHQASSPAPPVPPFCLWGTRSGAVSGQGVPAWFGDAGTGSVPPAMSSCAWSLAYGNAIFLLQLDCNL